MMMMMIIRFLKKAGGSIADGTRIEAAKTPRGRDLVSGWGEAWEKIYDFSICILK